MTQAPVKITIKIGCSLRKRRDRGLSDHLVPYIGRPYLGIDKKFALEVHPDREPDGSISPRCRGITIDYDTLYGSSTNKNRQHDILLDASDKNEKYRVRIIADDPRGDGALRYSRWSVNEEPPGSNVWLLTESGWLPPLELAARLSSAVVTGITAYLAWRLDWSPAWFENLRGALTHSTSQFWQRLAEHRFFLLAALPIGVVLVAWAWPQIKERWAEYSQAKSKKVEREGQQ